MLYTVLPMPYTENFFSSKNRKTNRKKIDIFNNFAQSIDCGFTLEPPRRVWTLAFSPAQIFSMDLEVGYKVFFLMDSCR